ncbi:MAG: diguanylate cyclase [Thermoanaerobaculia bacterium]
MDESDSTANQRRAAAKRLRNAERPGTASRRPTTRSQTVPDEARAERAESAGVEANIILIAHPDSKHIGTRYRLSHGSSLEIGRNPNVEVCLPEVPSISRNHARLEYLTGLVILRDLGSTNGTHVNDRLLDGPAVLKSGDRFQVGAVHFKFLHERDVEHAFHMAIFDLITRDGLTEAYNKRKFDEELDREFARSRRYSRPLSLILFDVDHFKAVNDEHGHLAGDFVLKQICERVSECIRLEQVFARVGGEEFAVLCPETEAPAATALAEKMKSRIAGEPCHTGKGAISVTCSFGVAPREAGMSGGPGDLVEAADRALYESKKAGRNRVTAALPKTG